MFFKVKYSSSLGSSQARRSCIKGLVEFFGDRPLSEITPSLINESKVKRKAGGVKPGTIHRQFDILRRAFNVAMREWEWCDTNPVTRVFLDRLDNKRDRWLFPESEIALLEVCPPGVKEIVLLTLNTGMRLGENLSLTWQGVDLSRKTVTVFRLKNGERWTIPINRAAFELLKAKGKVRSIKTDLVFHTKAHTPIDKCNFGRAFRAAVKRAGI